MDRKLSEWKLGVDRIWWAATPDYADAMRIVAEIADLSEETLLRQAATQALPSLRNASPGNADGNAKDAARGVVCVSSAKSCTHSPAHGSAGAKPV